MFVPALRTCGVMVLLCAVSMRAAHAARPLVTDDARITDAGACQIEAWQRVNRGSREYYGMEPSVSSIETFRTTYEMSRRYMSGGDPRDVKLDTLSESELRRRYDALRTDRIQRNTMEARRSLITSIFSLLIAAALFAFHWRWLRRIPCTVSRSPMPCGPSCPCKPQPTTWTRRFMARGGHSSLLLPRGPIRASS